MSKTGGGVVRQWDVLKLMVPEEEIPEFVDPMKWLAYFPPYGKEDLKRFGICTVRSRREAHTLGWPTALRKTIGARGASLHVMLVFGAREAGEAVCVLTLVHHVCLQDWRRSFITTSINPYYDSFIRWQFRLLNERGRVKFGKRPNVYSPLDGQVGPSPSS